MPRYRRSPLELRDEVRDVLAGAGLTEVVTHALVAPDMDERLNWPLGSANGVIGEGDAAWDAIGPIRVVNPLSSQHSVLRRDVVGSLLDVLSNNLRQGRADVAIYEIGKGYGLRDGQPQEWWRLAMVATGAAEPRAWNRPLRPYDIDDLKGVVDLLAHELGYGRPAYAPFREGYPLHPGRTAQVSLRRDGTADAPFLVAGVVGELHPEVLERWEIRADRVVAGELAIAGLSGGGLRAVKASAVPRFPVVERDIAVVVAGDRPSSEIQELIRDAAGPLLADVRLFDVYPMPDGDRSLAFRVSLQPIERTLTDAEIDEAMADTVGALERNGARLRG